MTYMWAYFSLRKLRGEWEQLILIWDVASFQIKLMMSKRLISTEINDWPHPSEAGVRRWHIIRTDVLYTGHTCRTHKTNFFIYLFFFSPGFPVLLWNLLCADLPGVQHGPSHGPHLHLPSRRSTGLQGHHHPTAGWCTAGTTGCPGELGAWKGLDKSNNSFVSALRLESDLSCKDRGQTEESSCVFPSSLSREQPAIRKINWNLFESGQSWAIARPEVRGVQLAPRGGGSHGVRSGGGRDEGQRGGGVERRMGEGRWGI